MNSHTYSTSSGMSLIEAMVWIAIFTSTMLALVSTVISFYHTNSYALAEANAVISGQHGIDNMVRTLREASYASNGAYPIASIGSTTVSVYANVNADASVERITYSLASTSLSEAIVAPTGNPLVYNGATTTSTIADYVRNFEDGVRLFTYYDKNGAEVTDYSKIGDVRFVSVTIIVDIDQIHKPDQLTLRSSAALRNLIIH